MYKNLFKPILDVVAAIVLMIMMSPVFIIILLILLVVNKGKPFFFQSRPGKERKPFTIIKFRTMNDSRDQQGNLLPDSQRMSAIGKWIRSTSLDELPQLINVIKGDMSFVGPRPLLMEYLPLYNDYQDQRHEVKPGITGWAQVNGRNAITWKEKFDYDIYYIRRISFILDCTIILKTIIKVFNRSDINRSGEITMNRFKGNKE